MIENRESDRCLWGSVQLYGRVGEETLKYAEMILKSDYREIEEEKNITAKELARMAEEEKKLLYQTAICTYTNMQYSPRKKLFHY